MTVIIIGAGVIGTALALDLQHSGRQTVLLDPNAPGSGCSFGNCASLATAGFEPASTPGTWLKVPGWLLDPLGPFRIRPADLPALAPWLLRFALAGRPARVEFDHRRTDGAEAAARVAFTPVFSDRPGLDGRRAVRGFYLLSLDVTEERRAAEALLQSKKMQAAAQLTRGLAHDFSNLLTVILGMQGRILGDPALPQAAREAAEATRAAARRGADLIQRLSNASQRRELTRARADAGALLRGLAELTAASMPPGVTLTAGIAEDLPPAWVDAGQLQDAMLNLLLNARDAVAGMARRWDAGLADWIEAEVAFPNGMVDRITPATGDRERARLAAEFGIEDSYPVFCEDFIQWVLEDNFPAGRPPLEQVGVQFVPDVTPYENMKIRVLNGGHAVIAYPSGLMGIEFAHEAMAHPLVDGFLSKVENEEILPSFDAPAGEDKQAYFQLIRRRFANPAVADQIRRLCLDGSNRQPKFIIPTIADRLAAGAPVTGLALESALWRRYCMGVDESGAQIAPNDPNWDRLTAVAAEAEDAPMAWLGMEDIYGETGRAAPFRDAFAAAHAALKADGTEATLRRYIDGGL